MGGSRRATPSAHYAKFQFSTVALNLEPLRLNSACPGYHPMPGAELQPNTVPSWAQKFNHLFGYANGTNFAPGGLAWVGERGPELVNLPRGSRVIPNHELRSGGGIHFHGDIVIHQQPGQPPEHLADVVMRRLGTLMRNQSLASGTEPQFAWR